MRASGLKWFRRINRRFDRKLQLSTCVAVITSVALLSVTAFAVDPTIEAEHQQTVFRSGGSDTTYEMMVALDTFYNASPGCLTVDTRIKTNQSGTHLHNNTCQEEDVTEDLVAPFDPVGHPPGGFDPDSTPTPQVSRRANYDHDVIMQHFPLGSSFGVRQLQRQDAVAAGTFKCGRSAATAAGEGPANGTVIKDCPPLDLARSSRPLSAAEINPTGNGGLRGFGYAREALTWVCFPGPTAGCSGGAMAGPDGVGGTEDDNRNLTTAQITGIMRCDPGFRFWHEVGGGGSAASPIPIRVFSAQQGSGTRGSWDTLVNGGPLTNDGRAVGSDGVPGTCAKAIFENNANPIIGTGEEDQAFYYFSSGRHSKPKSAAGTEQGKVNGLAVSQSTVNGVVNATTRVEGNPPHPYARTVFNIIRHNDPEGLNAPKEVREYVDENGFLCKPASKHQDVATANTLLLLIEKEGFFRPPLARSNQTLLPGHESHCRVNIQYNNTFG